MLKNFIKRYFKTFVFFYSYLGARIFVMIGLGILLGLLDGFGLAMFIPLFKMADGNVNAGAAEGLGKLKFLFDILPTIGLSVTLNSILLMMLLLFIFKGIIRFYENYYKVLLRVIFIRKLRYQLADGLTSLAYKLFSSMDAGRIQNSLTGETARVAMTFQSYLDVLQQGVLILVYLSLALAANHEFAIMVSIGGIFTNIVYKLFYKLTKKLSIKISSKAHNFQSFLIQSVQYFKYLKATNAVSLYKKRLKETINEIELIHKRIGWLNAFVSALREPLVIFIVVVVIVVQVNFLGRNLAVMLLSLMFFYRALNSLLSLQTSWNSYYTNVGALEGIQEILVDFSKGKEPAASGSYSPFEKDIALKNVSFGYSEGHNILNDISLAIGRNSWVAFVGESGSGKTTLVNIICGLLDPVSGSVEVDGRNLSQIDKSLFRSRIGYITQEPVVFNDTIFNNVSLWSEPTPENVTKFWQVLNITHIDFFIRGLDSKENTVLGDQGVLLSGGQKQRICLARELFKECDLLLMDEATSALDSETEKIIQQNLSDLKGKYTMLTIAHRLSTIKNADVIHLIEKGRIVKSGSFDALMASSAEFRKMVELQEFQLSR